MSLTSRMVAIKMSKVGKNIEKLWLLYIGRNVNGAAALGKWSGAFSNIELQGNPAVPKRNEKVYLHTKSGRMFVTVLLCRKKVETTQMFISG